MTSKRSKRGCGTLNGAAPIAEDCVKGMGTLYRVEVRFRSLDPKDALAGRPERSAPPTGDIQTWLFHRRAHIATKAQPGNGLAYNAKSWDRLQLF